MERKRFNPETYHRKPTNSHRVINEFGWVPRKGNPISLVKFNDTNNMLIAGGCSFTDPRSSAYGQWPEFLADEIHYTSLNHGQISSGNKIISKRVRWQVMESLKTHKPEELLVGICWSGPTRGEIHLPYGQDILNNYKTPKESVYHPLTQFPPDAEDGYWRIINSHFVTHKGLLYSRPDANNIETYYKSITNTCQHWTNTLEEILHTQYLLKLYNIRYFMFAYMFEVYTMFEAPSCKWLADQIDYDYWLPINDYYSWFMEIETGKPPQGPGHEHPTDTHNQWLATEVIVPFLKDKNWI